ncbi:MAG TPA: hypothetical protein DEQ87_15050 [Algoriphagus sp.]|jgi:hypothetical protein|nr:hypothetical protein [Algoriphagus sp.]MAN88095.1 hypothetical protein [Algoriphagus sp.]HAD51242.1 hypothetical protein [Algoriphagus sp.]HAH35180.1 hypothetical protein [Algoriphagus sp.]HAS60145.1 hypothetical protein [Algoriphagus sp.]|tara:strand:- start:1470 stop:1667 length:198 start_codon:yes stop_codon:yes gene_type:complete
MSKRRLHFHLSIILFALFIGGLSNWQSGFWMEGRNKVPNFTGITMVLLMIGRGGMVLRGFKKGKN